MIEVAHFILVMKLWFEEIQNLLVKYSSGFSWCRKMILDGGREGTREKKEVLCYY